MNMSVATESNSIAILLDLDNVKPRLERIEEICATHGRVVERRAFANTAAVLTAYGSTFRRLGYRFELTPGLDPVPQEVDELIFRTARELAMRRTNRIDTVVIVSNDNDYAELCLEMRRHSIRTLAIGNQVGQQLRRAADGVEDLLDVLRPCYVGIDLGTTNTVMAQASLALATRRWTASAIETPVSSEQRALVNSTFIPSSVRFGLPQPEIGGHVRAQAFATRTRTVLAWKHHMGVSAQGQPHHYQLEQPAVAGGNLPGYLARYAATGRVAPEEAAAAVLAHCRKHLAQRYPAMQGVVITHPASYESDAIEATRRAAVLAGWGEDDVVLLPEPHAALFDFLDRLQNGELGDVLDVGVPNHILVYDLGGGTLDVSLHRVRWDAEAQRFCIDDIAVGSRTRVGGDLVDQLLAEHLVRSASAHLSADDRQSLLHEVRLAVERFKKTWGSEYERASDGNSFRFPFQGNFLQGRVPLRVQVDRALMESMLAPLLCPDLDMDRVHHLDLATAFEATPFTDRMDTFVVPVLELLLKARMSQGSVPRIDAVLLNGGMTYFPLVRERLGSLFGTSVPLLTHGNPDLAVARGAALFAAGAQGAGARRVNPTHIYLEVKDGPNARLERLVAQGQTYPYRTVLPRHRIPDSQDGVVPFRIWVGMGARPGVNTVLQRERYVPLQAIQAADLAPGTLLDLEVEYTFDERLVLTLVSADARRQRFVVEVSHEGRAHPVAAPKPTEGPSLPVIARKRIPVEATEREVHAEQWARLARDLAILSSDRMLRQAVRSLACTSALAVNRLQLAESLLPWLDSCLYAPARSSMRCNLALLAVRAILRNVAADDPRGRGIDACLQEHVRGEIRRLNRRAGFLNRTLIQELAETPGKLLWTGFDDVLRSGFDACASESFSGAFINSLAKCGAPAHNLEFAARVLESSDLAHREKGAFALARFLSPGQPAECRVTADVAYRWLPLFLERLLARERDPRVLISLAGCVYQVIAWEAVTRAPIPAALRQQVLGLSVDHLAATRSLARFPDIAQKCETRFDLMPKLLSWGTATREEQHRIQEFLLEIVGEEERPCPPRAAGAPRGGLVSGRQA